MITELRSVDNLIYCDLTSKQNSKKFRDQWTWFIMTRSLGWRRKIDENGEWISLRNSLFNSNRTRKNLTWTHTVRSIEPRSSGSTSSFVSSKSLIDSRPVGFSLCGLRRFLFCFPIFNLVGSVDYNNKLNNSTREIKTQHVCCNLVQKINTKAWENRQMTAAMERGRTAQLEQTTSEWTLLFLMLAHFNHSVISSRSLFPCANLPGQSAVSDLESWISLLFSSPEIEDKVEI